ncbi:non-specific serine,threonine protein kinase [Sarracenia purpurea var. burkii]
MGYLSCNTECSIAICDPQNWELTRKTLNNTRNKPFKIREFSFSDLYAATDGFSPESFLGKGSHGSVYKAVLDGGKLVAAVKKSPSTTTSNSSETNCNKSKNCVINSPAENEIEILSRVRSPRLVNLLGFGVDSEKRKLIVVEFMPNGSLYDLIHRSKIRPPGWARRIRFTLQIARAVQHLHFSNPPVIHRDIKSSNVLIDGDWNARLGDFGLALRGHVDDVRVTCTPPAGTLGYLDPCYLAPGDLSAKSDVFSFGILLLEMMSGRNAIDLNYSPPSVVDWAAPLIRSGDYAAICDPRIRPPEDQAVIRQLAVLAARCVRSTAEKRPAIEDVVACLKSVKKRVPSPIWNNLRRREVKPPSQTVKYKPLDDRTEVFKASRLGSRRNSKVSSVAGVRSVTEALRSSKDDRVSRSRSVGSVREMKLGPLDSNFGGNQLGLVRKRAGLGVKMPTIRLNKSRSMGMLQSVGKLEESKLLINLEKRGPDPDVDNTI